jgi:hypothetical protein
MIFEGFFFQGIQHTYTFAGVKSNAGLLVTRANFPRPFNLDFCLLTDLAPINL